MLKYNLIGKISEINNNKTPLGNTISSNVFYMYLHLGHVFFIPDMLKIGLDVMCALKFDTFFVKDKYQMATICNFVQL